jgi:hypothetical protein
MALKIVQISGATPQRAIARVELKDTDSVRLEDVLAWTGINLRGIVWWSRTQFRDPATSRMAVCPDSRQKHFKDGYWVHRFWFSRKRDAALFILWWGSFRPGR